MNGRNRWNNMMGPKWMGSGMGRGFCGGRWWFETPPSGLQPQTTQQEPTGSLTYIGPCRCGWGPHAYYRDQEGRIIHASRLGWRIPPQTSQEKPSSETNK